MCLKPSVLTETNKVVELAALSVDGREGGWRSWLIPWSWRSVQIIPDNGEKWCIHPWKSAWPKGSEQKPSLWSWPCPVSLSGCNRLGCVSCGLYAGCLHLLQENTTRVGTLGQVLACAVVWETSEGRVEVYSRIQSARFDPEERRLGRDDDIFFLPIKVSSFVIWKI